MTFCTVFPFSYFRRYFFTGNLMIPSHIQTLLKHFISKAFIVHVFLVVVITFIVDSNRRSGAVVVLILWLEARRQLAEVRLIKRPGVVLAKPQINIQLGLHCPATLTLTLLARLLLCLLHSTHAVQFTKYRFTLLLFGNKSNRTETLTQYGLNSRSIILFSII